MTMRQTPPGASLAGSLRRLSATAGSPNAKQTDNPPPMTSYANGSGENYRPLTLAPVRDGA